MDVARAGDIVPDLLVRYSFQGLAALAIFGLGVPWRWTSSASR